ncbi:hypothetical protein ACH5BF_08205 [Arcobacter sp. YIC-464]|uniref:hypothetical protein n=1 Tax=Arcobacter sp. YIC-464 TaxID=3376631 RepID=UPI003C1E602D
MNIMFFGFIFLVLILISFLVYFIVKKNSNCSSQTSKIEEKPKDKVDISHLPIPSKVQDFNSLMLMKASSKIFDIFKAVDYANRSEHGLNKIEWHAWQVSILLYLLKMDYNLNVEVSKENFHPFIYRMKKEELLTKFDEILEKYLYEVDISQTKDELCKDMLLSGREISILFFFILNKKSFLK